MRGADATWQNQRVGEPSPLSTRQRVQPTTSWWLNVSRAAWSQAVHMRWRGSDAHALEQTIDDV